MKREEILLRELCFEMAENGVDSDRFTRLWMESGISLDSLEFDIANKILMKFDQDSLAYMRKQSTYH